MKVLLLTTHINMGGVGRYVFELARGLKQKNVDCTVASSGGNLERFFHNGNIHLFTVDIKTKCEFHPKLILGVSQLADLVKRDNIDIIHAHTRVAQVLGCLLSRMTKVPFVTTCHGFFKSGRLSRKIFPCWGKRVIAISDAVRGHLTDDFKLPNEQVSVIYNGVDMAEYDIDMPVEKRRILKRNLGFTDGHVIGSIGRLSPVKGYDYLLHAIKEMKSRKYDVNLLLVGDGPEDKRLQGLTKRLGLENMVFFMKSRFDARRFFPLMDVYVLPSLQEGLGLSLLEAMASGRACVATRVGGISDVIQDGMNGLLVPPRDPRALANAITNLLDDSGVAGELGSNARGTVKNRFSLDEMISKTIGFYKGVMGEE